MRVVVEVSVIGLAQLFETARTGIYRVICSLVPELLQDDSHDIRLTSLSSTEINRLTRDYFMASGYGQRFIGNNRFEERLFDMSTLLSAVDKKKIVQRGISRAFRKSKIACVADLADIYHSTFSPLPGFQDGPESFLTIYDIIPLLHPGYFWGNFDAEFKQIVSSVRVQKDWVLTISQSSKNDICTYLNMSPDRVFVTYPAADPFLYYPETDSEKIHVSLQKYNIPEPGYFLSLATLEYRKNLRSSIMAFKKILNEPGCGDRHLVLVGTKGWKVDQLLEEVAADSLLRKRVIFTGYVEDKDLSALYSGALAFLYPSLYEGFGLPPLEAMQCGVPVITSDTSSLPEVIGKAGIMVPPTDTDALAQAMLDVVDNDSLREGLQAKGLQQAAQFSWTQCARDTVAAYEYAFQSVS